VTCYIKISLLIPPKYKLRNSECHILQQYFATVVDISHCWRFIYYAGRFGIRINLPKKEHCRKYKTLRLGGGQAYDRPIFWTVVISLSNM